MGITSLQYEGQLMDRIAELEARVAELEGGVAAARDHAAQLLRQASRYVWIRENTVPYSLALHAGVDFGDLADDESIAERVDRICDAAIARKALAGKEKPAP